MHRRLQLALVAPCLLALLAACGDGNGGKTVADAGTIAALTPSAVPTAVTPVDTATSPKLSGPASRFSILLAEVGTSYITDIPATFVLDLEMYARTKGFKSADEGRKLLAEWGYAGGYETGLQPEGREIGVLNGGYYVALETHLFKDEEGAKKAYTYYDLILKGSVSQPVSSQPIGNSSSAWTLVEGKVKGSSVDAVLHQIIFRRGNLVAIVATYGAKSFMTIEDCYRMATIVDEKALSKRDATEPTPTSNFATPTIAGRSAATPSPTASR